MEPMDTHLLQALLVNLKLVIHESHFKKYSERPFCYALFKNTHIWKFLYEGLI